MTTRRLQNFRPQAVRLIRAGMDAATSGDLGALTDTVRRTERCLPRDEKLRLMTTTLVVAAIAIRAGDVGSADDVLSDAAKLGDDEWMDVLVRRLLAMAAAADE